MLGRFMEQLLKSIATDIFSGYSFRNKIEHQENGGIHVLQMKDLDDDYTCLTGHSLTKTNIDNVSERYFLKRGDVLFVAKGTNNFAVTYNLGLPKAIAVSAFFILRFDINTILPEYIAWYINQRPVQLYLKENTAGTYIGNINKATLENIVVPLPDIDVQKTIVDIDALRNRENVLMQAIATKRQVVVSQALLELTKQ